MDSISLCLGLVGSLITPGVFSFAEEVVSNVNEALSKGPSSENVIQVPNEKPNLSVNLNQELDKFKGLDSSEQVVHESEEIVPKINQAASKSLQVDVQPKDVFQLSQEQLEELMSKGYSVEDLYKLDELANSLYVEPLTLIEQKEKEKLSWEELEQKVASDIEATQLAQLSQTYPKPYEQLKRETSLTDRERLSLLVAFDMGKGTMSELIKAFKTGGEKEVVNYDSKLKLKNKTNRNSISSFSAKSSSTSQETVDTEVLEKIRDISKKSGISEEELVQQFKDPKEASKQVLSGKE
ncbi:transcriptional regulator with XRE-family HTH domain [Paenibacillus turicensis]|uniref:Transcriptional regulator with XRE-family HTH domain n=1 Tax=Paenibacillus turicensis TaxID=160487 RepID=A0ABS4FLJ5_9BACL|nr:hypothetical protein [Paenibacillus turicensis]MBP1903458.1 transcriptional regulator with XRE-family HTH domain [Paenibacillus turicensis]